MGEGRIARGLLLLAVSASFMGLQLSAARGAESPSQLRVGAGAQRAESEALSARERATWLSIVSLETRLEQSRAALVRLRARARRIAAARAEAERTLAIARRGVAISQRRLALRVRALYEQGDADPLAVVLGATSIGEVIEGLDGLDRVAGHDRELVVQAKQARSRLLRRTRLLAAREAEAVRAADAAAATAAALEGARRERTALLAQLRAERRAAAASASSLEARAASLARSGASAPVPAAPQSPPRRATSGSTLTVTATGYALRGRTATGVPVAWGIAAVDPSVIPLGTRMTVPGYGEAVAADTGGAIVGAKIDLWFPTTAEALAWGTRTVTITLH